MKDTSDSAITTADFPDTGEVVSTCTSDFHLPPLEGIVDIRVRQIVEGFNLLDSEGLDEQGLSKSQAVMRAIAVAYKLGAKDGLARLGELL